MHRLEMFERKEEGFATVLTTKEEILEVVAMGLNRWVVISTSLSSQMVMVRPSCGSKTLEVADSREQL